MQVLRLSPSDFRQLNNVGRHKAQNDRPYEGNTSSFAAYNESQKLRTIFHKYPKIFSPRKLTNQVILKQCENRTLQRNQSPQL